MRKDEKATDLRREMILAVIREFRISYPTSAGILGRLDALHADGEWPQASWSYARSDPYPVGLRQHLLAMEMLGWVERQDDGGWKATAKAPATQPLPKPLTIEEKAAAKLPDDAAYEDRLALFESRFGSPIILGVDFGLNCVIRYMTADGMAEIPVEDEDWDRALTEVGA